MKYRIGNIIVNSAYIVCVEYDPASSDSQSHVLITTSGTAGNPDWDGTFEFVGAEADRFWTEYGRGAIDVMLTEEE